MLNRNMKDIVYVLAKTEDDKKEAVFLMEKEYVKQGYLKPGAVQNIEISNNGSVTFLAKYNNKIVGTVSIFFDSELGLPMDAIYKKETDVLRSQNKKIVEVGRLAIDNIFLSNEAGFKKKYNSLFLVSSLFKLVFHYCIYKNFDNICIAINPKHDLFYKSLFFENIGGLKFYPSVNNAPALAKTIDLKNYKNKRVKNYLLDKLFFDNPPDYKIFETQL